MPCFSERTRFAGGGGIAPARKTIVSPARTGSTAPAAPRNVRASGTQNSRGPAPAPANKVTSASGMTTSSGPNSVKTGVASATRQVIRAQVAPTIREQHLLNSLRDSEAAARSASTHTNEVGLDRFVDALDRAKRSASVAMLVAEREADYLDGAPRNTELLHVTLERGVTYSYDATQPNSTGGPSNRVLAVWGVSGKPDGPREAARLAGYPSPTGKGSKPLDRGHLVAHSAGGTEDGINLIPQDRELNRGTGSEIDKKRWRAFERDLSDRPGTPFIVRPQYVDDSDFPGAIEIGFQLGDGTWGFQTLANK